MTASSSVAQYDREKLVLDKLFSDVTWKTILHNIKAPSDLENITNASPYFRNLLLETRVVFLFPKVFKLLDMKYHQTPATHVKNKRAKLKSVIYDGDAYNHCMGCQNFVGLSWTKAILNCRSVCKLWKNIIDNMLTGKEKAGDDGICGNHGFIYYFLNTLDLDPRRFLIEFKNTHPLGSEENPFISRSLRLDFSLPLSTKVHPENISMALLNLLTWYGDHVFHCEIIIGYGLVRSYKHIAEVLWRLPNLKTLSVSCQLNKRRFAEPEKEYLKELEIAFALQPLPIIPHLQKIDLQEIHFLIFNQIMERYCRVPHLRIDTYTCNFSINGYIIQPNDLENLKELEIEFNDSEEIKVLATPQKWKINKLVLHFAGNKAVDWSSIFKFLEKNFGKELISLEINCNKQHKLDTQFAGMKLNLSGLCDFNFFHPNLNSVEFILPMCNTLQILRLQSYYKNMSEEQQLAKAMLVECSRHIKILSCFKGLRESNMFNLFDKLQLVSVNKNFKVGERVMKITRREWQRCNM